jgi:hypothetical protein
MNLVAVTSWCIQEPVRRVSAATRTERVTWRGGVTDAQGAEHIFNFEVSEPALADLVERELQPGRKYEAQGELVTRPYSKHGVTVAQLEVVAVDRIRLGKAVGQKTEDGGQKTEETKP